ncbi:hypothetical protein BD309DRAFT_876522 [Dichomitus squalens]|uniref:Uncharacterized protein n=1 Tax=Dichomitus squalens TaxID=114155 RepID=A0A4V2K6F9_9APHY|nr:hypothetical protein BD309DRAFT_876522 [Dichomitus squalens]TBU51943.1 hypothetical protein BD310DRAFT_833241 [Dichomitus squalens]
MILPHRPPFVHPQRMSLRTILPPPRGTCHIALTCRTAIGHIFLSSACPSAREASKKPKRAAVSGGLHREWQDWYKTPVKSDRPRPQISKVKPSKQQANATVPSKVRASRVREPSTETEGVHDYAGLHDEDETAERDALTDDRPTTTLTWGDDAEDDDVLSSDEGVDRETAVVVVRRKDIYTSVRRITAAEAAAPSGTKKTRERNRPNGKNIPDEYKKDFNLRLVPFLRAVAGTKVPFTPLELKQKRQIFKIIFPWSDLELEPDSVFSVVMDSRLSEWKNKFREAALMAVEAEMMDPEWNLSREDRIAFARYQLALAPGADRSDKDTIKNMRAPFFWADFEEGHRHGKFEGPMLLKTLAYAHFPVLEAVPSDLRGQIENIYGTSIPTGALIMAALALEFALHAWLTGNLRTARGAEGQFSADNWGDKVIRQNGVTFQENKVKSLFERASALKDDRICRIIDHCRSLCSDRRKQVSKAEVNDGVQEDTAPDYASSDRFACSQCTLYIC